MQSNSIVIRIRTGLQSEDGSIVIDILLSVKRLVGNQAGLNICLMS